jgi:membrane-associated phospholipid phosphatase
MYLKFTKYILLFALLFFVNINMLQAQYSKNAFLTANNIQKTGFSRHKKNVLVNSDIQLLTITCGVYFSKNNTLRRVDNYIYNKVHRHNYLLHTKLDDYAQFSPAIAAFGLKLAGIKSKHKLFDMAIMYALSNTLETGIVYTTKQVVKRIRPDSSKKNSFPSGHTATAFVAAEFLHQEYKDQSVWISIGGYTAASLTGVSRILNDRHWFSDVIAGAGIGIVSTKIVYRAYHNMHKVNGIKKLKHTQTFVLPTYNNKTLGISFLHSF